jgi:hypothetical protein
MRGWGSEPNSATAGYSPPADDLVLHTRTLGFL